MKGFGAPLWVLFLSVIGAGISTISLVVHEISDPPDFSEAVKNKIARKTLRKRFQVLVEHEFYILFAPIGGVFVYQLMVLSNVVNEPVTVAVAALGAGFSINALISRAVKSSADLIKSKENEVASNETAAGEVAASQQNDADPSPATSTSSGQASGS